MGIYGASGDGSGIGTEGSVGVGDAGEVGDEGLAVEGVEVPPGVLPSDAVGRAEDREPPVLRRALAEARHVDGADGREDARADVLGAAGLGA